MNARKPLYIIAAPWGLICESCYSDSKEYREHNEAHTWHHGEDCQCDTFKEAPPYDGPNPEGNRWPKMPAGFRHLTDAEVAGDIGRSCSDCGDPWDGLQESFEDLLDHDHSMDG